MSVNNGKAIIYITGAGPGDPGLLTIKAKEVIKECDVIVYDNLVSKEILELALFLNPNTKLLYAGKISGEYEESTNQESIHELLLKLSKEYKIICRLKGGDPLIFGRGGEEAVFLQENDINFEIIPGVSSISSVPAYAGIPVSHRDCNSSFTVITAHEDPDNPDNKINWESFDAINNTLILLMGVKNLPKIIKKLISLGRSLNTPVAIIYRGTTSRQKVIKATLNNVLENIEKKQIKAPSVIVIGKVVKYRELLNWFESKPLFGKRILITRSREQSFSFMEKLIQSGAKPIICPLVSYEINKKEIYNKNIINNLSRYDWIFFTSYNSVRFFFEILEKNYYDSRALSGINTACVGYKTKLELEKYNIKADFIPKKFSFKSLVHELGEITNLQDKKILHPVQAEVTHSTLLQITTWPIYNAIFTCELNEEIINEIKESIDVITFFSSNTAKHFAELISKYNWASLDLSLLAAIGNETSDTVKQLFGRVDIIAEPFTEEGLITAMEKYFYDKHNFKIQTKTTT